MNHGEMITSKHGTSEEIVLITSHILTCSKSFSLLCLHFTVALSLSLQDIPDSCRFIGMRIRHLKSGKNKYKLVLIYYAAVLINSVCPTDLLASKHLHTLVQGSLLEVIEYILESFTLQEEKSDYLEW